MKENILIPSKSNTFFYSHFLSILCEVWSGRRRRRPSSFEKKGKKKDTKGIYNYLYYI